MSLAIGWDTPDGAPTMTTYLLVAFVSLLAAVTVVLALRWRDRRQLLRERLPYTRLVMQNQKMAERAQRVLAEQADQMAALDTAVGQILQLAAEQCPDACEMKRAQLRLVRNV